MAWDLILWLIVFCINIALLASTLYQVICLSDLESDYLNPYESSSRINALILPEFILQTVLCALFLLTWHWFMFMLTLPLTYYNVTLYIKKLHLVDVTEIFRTLNGEKKYRIVKLVFYSMLFCIITVRLVISIFNSLVDADDAVHIF
uniref:Cornichon family protein n=1 Tax=Kalanchoe fedtschenkoi TaxID=63787 RepID=A0A7N0TC41_KALFE